ncbi:hypothetical protein HPO96_33290 [Kribbella sandramycini]|uniref:Uncharacterized protein n=1 Tax=Kribbella sandramycini TaxID=60450 RepID=A0A7Y4L662_9ACTN|nr:hypothetical protein [Kribbella sandramycini]MBB6566135.1 hypothetical protein [Kribbella sandramycini]NOL45135.1 hypothetical protein [Kribbella sandramycini]
MRNNNGRLVALVASVAVAAVVLGAALAYRQGPQPTNAGAQAAPLTSAPNKPNAPDTPNTPPAATGPVKTTVDVNKLSEGRAPQIPHLVGREVRGGSAGVQVVPGKGSVLRVGRLGNDTLAVVMYEPDGDGSELLKLTTSDAEPRRTPNVTSLVTTPDQTMAAYAAAHISSLGVAVKGGTVYAETGESLKSLKLPDAWELQVLSIVDGKVYYRASDKELGPWKLYTWTPGESKPELLKRIVSPTAISAGGATAASMGTITDDGTCTHVVSVPDGTQAFRTCDYRVEGFNPSGLTAYGVEGNSEGYCSGVTAALDASSGKLLHEWKGCFQNLVAEDDQHILIVAYATPPGEIDKVKTAIVRCAITTGACERATPIGLNTNLVLGT